MRPHPRKSCSMGANSAAGRTGDLNERFASWLADAPAGTLIPAAALAQLLRPAEPPVPAGAPSGQAGTTWRERLWTAPPETRIGVHELCEAVGRGKSWVYRHTSPKSGLSQLPHRKLDGDLVFVVGEIRAWITVNEDVVVRGILPLSRPNLRRTA